MKFWRVSVLKSDTQADIEPWVCCGIGSTGLECPMMWMTGNDHHTGTSTNYKSLTALLLCLQVGEPLVSKHLGVLLLFNHYSYIRAKNLQVVAQCIWLNKWFFFNLLCVWFCRLWVQIHASVYCPSKMRFTATLFQTTARHEAAHFSPCPESTQNLPYLYSSSFVPLATHWFINRVQTRFSVLQTASSLLLSSIWLNSWRFTHQTVSYALLLILPFFVFPLCVHALTWSEIFFLCCTVHLEQSPFQS